MTYQEYMDLLQTKVIDILSKGINPWQLSDRARNGMTDRLYSGANALLLNIMSETLYSGDKRWYTFNQAKKLGCSVKTGEKATPAYFFQRTIEQPMKDEEGNIIKDSNGLTVYETKRIPPIFKIYYVFNARQLDPIPRLKGTEPDDSYDKDHAEEIRAASPARINYKDHIIPSYNPSKDEITIPLMSSFADETEFYSVLFHELAHSTGSMDRLARDMGSRFGSESYAIEELIAEITALSLCENCNMRYTHTRSADYIASWLEAVEDPDFSLASIYSAVSKAARFLEHPEDRTRLITQERNREDAMLLYNGENYLHIQRCESGEEPWDYSIYDRGMNLLDGGRIGTEGLRISAAADQISQRHSFDPSLWERVEISALHERPEMDAVQEKAIGDADHPKTEKEGKTLSPTVRFTYSDSKRVPKGKDMSLAEADRLLASLGGDAERPGEAIETSYRVSLRLDGEEKSCTGKYIIGIHAGSIVDQIRMKAEALLSSEALQEKIRERKGEERLREILAEKKEEIERIIPILECHRSLDAQQEQSKAFLETLEKPKPTAVEREFMEYSKAMLDWVERQRANLSEGKLAGILTPPRLEDYQFIMPDNAEAIKTVYISGPITADPDHARRFSNAEKALAEAGYKAINPVELVKDRLPGDLSAAETWRRAMEIDLEALRTSDAVVLLDKNGFQSTGMDIEIHMAARMDIPLVTLDHILSWKKEKDKAEDVPAKMETEHRSPMR